MTSEAHISLLADIDLLASFERETLAKLIDQCPIVELKAGEALFDYGSNDNCMFVILHGCLQVCRNDLILSELTAPDYIGELSLIETKPRSASASAKQATTLLQIDQAMFDKYLRSDAHALASMMRTLSQRLRSANEDINNTYQDINVLLHDMRNMLCALNFASVVAMQLPDDSPCQSHLRVINETEQRLENLLDQALKHAKGQSIEHQKSETNVEQLINECLAHDLAMHPDVDNTTIHVHCPHELLSIPLNALDLKRVIANLIINAAQASESPATIDITIRQGKNTTTLNIQDCGDGIPEIYKAHIFDPHFTSKPTGNGLGLLSCKNIIEKDHSGCLTFESTQGIGTTFICELPNF